MFDLSKNKSNQNRSPYQPKLIQHLMDSSEDEESYED
jgi:hypothetical protein